MGAFDKIKNMLEDFRFGIRTRGTARTTKAGSVYYASVDCALTRDVLDRLNLGPADTFVDIGAGKGRVLALAARYSVKRIIGIEYEPELAEQARLNLRRMRTAGPPIIIHEGAAEHFDYSDVTVAYLFNPVEADVLAKILEPISNSFEQHIYASNLHEA